VAGRDQRAVNRARRAARASARGEKRVLPKSFAKRAIAAQEEYVRAVYEGRIPEPPMGSAESRQLGRYASYARWNKADSEYEKAFNKYWYHVNDGNNDADRYEEGDETDTSFEDQDDE
jgi:hypothetical protein